MLRSTSRSCSAIALSSQAPATLLRVSVPGEVQLVPFGEDHLEATLGWLQDPGLRCQLDTLAEPTAAANTAYWRANVADPSREDYAILDGDGRHQGNCGLRDIDRQRRKAQIWAYVGEQRGSGLGWAAVQRLLTRGFDELGLNRVYLRVLADNPGAERFWQRLGFRLEGQARQDTCLDGRFVDSRWYSMLAEEYAAK